MSIEEVPPESDECAERKRPNTNPPRMDFKEIEKFGVIETSPEDMALLMHIPFERLKRQLDNPLSRTSRRYERGRALRRQAIKRKAYQVAIGAEEGNVPLLVRFLEIERKQEVADNNQTELLGRLAQSLSDTQKQTIVNLALGNLSTLKESEADKEVDDEFSN